ncbi:MAG: hypothetical protein E4H01_14990 [Lysobacterales bacterium]|nr:MAG: hypothetical protein E4H01_14990 [Xanthomonadales bacterium]
MSDVINLNYRPATYWPESLDQEQLLAKILGESRRSVARKILAEEGFAGLNDFFARETLDDDERKNWGLLHPQCMGGEYLSELELGELEIARISLASTTSDQISIRATHAGKKIRYSVCDEYETEFELAFTESEQPLTLGELIQLIDGSKHPEEECSGGLLVCHWEHMLSWGKGVDAAMDFAWIQSAWYRQLAAHYANVASTWRERNEAEYEAEDEGADDVPLDGSTNEVEPAVAQVLTMTKEVQAR